jgi:hypothetical protein
MTAFDQAASDLMACDDIALDATYTPLTGESSAIRAAWRPDVSSDTYGFEAQIKAGRRYLQVQAADVAAPGRYDRVVIGSDEYVVDGPDLSRSDAYFWVLAVSPA